MLSNIGRRIFQSTFACTTVLVAAACTVSSTPAATPDAGGMGGDGGTAADAGGTANDSGTPSDGAAIGDGATARVLGFTPSNVDLSGMDLTKIGDFLVDDPACTLDSESLLASCGNGDDVLAFKVAVQSDGSKVGVYVARSMNIAAGANLTVQHGYPIVFIALGAIDMTGNLYANAKSEVAVGGGYAQATAVSQGSGPGGGGAGTDLIAPGGGSYCGKGGSGAVQIGTPASGGAAYGTATITPLVAGSSGGTGAGGGGGAGGGAIQLVAGTSITVRAGAVVHVGGGGGGFGGIGGQEPEAGGSGGAILFEAPIVSIDGTLAANGGGGGAGSSQSLPSGADGLSSASPATGGPGVSAGGNGSAAAVPNGSDGTYTADQNNAAGAGGGGAGRIRINTKTGAAAVTGVLSPSSASPCMTQGPLPS